MSLPGATVRPEGLSQWKIPMTPSRIEAATFRFVAQYLNQLCHHVPPIDFTTWVLYLRGKIIANQWTGDWVVPIVVLRACYKKESLDSVGNLSMIRLLSSPWPSFCTVSVTPATDANYTIVIIIIIIIIIFLGYLIMPKSKSDSTASITGWQ